MVGNTSSSGWCRRKLTAKAQQPGGVVSLRWPDTEQDVYVEFTPSLKPPQWRTIAGPLQGTNWTSTPVPGQPTGFYRLRLQ